MSMKSTLAEIVSAKNKDTHTLSQTNLVSEAIEKMSNRNIGALVILGDDGGVSGIFSERDLLNRVAAKGLDPASTALADVMTPDPICVDTSMTVEDAMHEVTDKRIRHLPLVSEGKMQGLISSRDLTAWAVTAQKSEIEGLRTKLASGAAKNKALIALIAGLAILVLIGVLSN
jgi:signal-transduction protein with cAMP-binding, CBS, and nucleotidyltransferase domain